MTKKQPSDHTPTHSRVRNSNSSINGNINNSNSSSSKISNTSNSRHSVLQLITPSKLHYDDANSTTPSTSTSASSGFSLRRYLQVELLGVGAPGELESPPKNENIMNFLRVPFQLECLVFFGCFVCWDSFLYVITYLPIRVCFCVLLLGNELHRMFWVMLLGEGGAGEDGKKKEGLVVSMMTSWLPRFHRTQAYDLMRGAMLIIGVVALRQINMSQVYHFIRGQNMIKLYVLASMMEVMDKLFSSFGQDAFDALHFQTRTNPKSFKLIQYFIITSLYVIAHSILYFFEVATYTVVINSSDEALLTVLILNNFAEMKSFVFKKFDNNNLFQLACSDITERFQIVLFLMTIMLVAIAQNDFQWNELVSGFLRIMLLMTVGEAIADSMKHAFINKFNSFNPDVYEDFSFVLRLDILGNRKDKIILDHTYAVTRRLGLSQIPLGCVFIRYMMLAISASSIQSTLSAMSWREFALYGGIIFIAVTIVKLILGIGLIRYSDRVQQIAGAQFAKMDSSDTPKMQRKLETVEKLSTIERYTVYNGRIL